MHTPLTIVKKYSWLLLAFLFFYSAAFIAHKIISSKLDVNNVGLKYNDYYKNQQTIIDHVFNNHGALDILKYKDIGVFVTKVDAVGNAIKYYSSNSFTYALNLIGKKIDTSFIINHDGNISEVYQRYFRDKDETVQIIFPLQNNYISPRILHFEQHDKLFYMDTLPSKISYKLQSKFNVYLNKNYSATSNQYNNYTIVLGLIAFIFFFVFLHLVTQEISKKCSFSKGFFVLLFVLALIRICFYEFSFPLDVSKLALFDPSIYASNKINKSLGDLLLNIYFVSWIFTFLRYHNFQKVKSIQAAFPKTVGFVQILLFCYLTTILIRILQSLVLDAQIPLNALEFYSLNRFTLAALTTLCGLVFLFLRIINLFFLHFAKQSIGFVFQAICIIASCVILIIFSPSNYSFYLWLLLWLIIGIAILNSEWFKQSIIDKTFSLLLTSILFFAISCSIVIQNQIKSLEQVLQNKTAERIHTLYGIENEFIQQCKSYENVYDIGVYHKDTLIYNFGNYPYPAIQNKNYVFRPLSSKLSVTNYDKDGISIFLVKEDTSILLLITLFNYFVVSFLLMSFLIVVTPKLFYFNREKYKEYFKFTIRSKILTIVLFATIGIYIVLAIFTIRYFITNFEKGIEDKLITTGKQSSNIIQSYLMNNTLNSFDTIADSKLLLELKNASTITFYDTSGIMISDFKVKKDSLSSVPQLINVQVLNDFRKLKPMFKLVNENVGGISFKSVYYSILKNNVCVGYLRLPFEKVEAYLQQETSGLIATLVNLSALFFIIIFNVVYYFANQLTKSLTIIGSKMNKINLNEVNETIEWKRNDEIGALVNQYNKMVIKLSESAKVLALNEREGAWKEMAKQVAHEIKNPLTPMKLSIQHLQYQIKQQPQNAEELTKKVVVNLVQQIDQLAKIANDFSQFASITSINPMKFEIKEILLQLQELYKGYTTIKFTFSLTNNDTLVFADKLQIKRLFTNLVKNAVEACEANERSTAQILIQQVVVANSVIISVCDSGAGIPNESIQNIFKPNFTTKSSGTGLGLAMCKGIVENANGKIWFETSTNGTTFFVEFPMVNADIKQ